MLAATLTLSVFEIILLFFGAIILGITIHFFIASRKNLKETTEELGKGKHAKDEWKVRYFNDMEVRDKELVELKEKLQEAEENASIYAMEADEMRRQNKLLQAELDRGDNKRSSSLSDDDDSESTESTVDTPSVSNEEIDQLLVTIEELTWKNHLLKTELEKKNKEVAANLSKENNSSHSSSVSEAQLNNANQKIAELEQFIMRLQHELSEKRAFVQSQEHGHSGKPDYMEQLSLAQQSLLEHNQKINQLLGNIDIIKEKEAKEREILRDKEELSVQLETLKAQLSEKENEIHSIKEKQHLTREMTSMLDNAYKEFDVLQDKMQKMESQLTSSKRMNMEMEDLKEAYTKLESDVELQRQKITGYLTENQSLREQLTETEDQLRETSFQRQQLQKRVAYLEELNSDLQVVSDANKKLESQLRRVGELESKLNVVSEERDELMSRQVDK